MGGCESPPVHPRPWFDGAEEESDADAKRDAKKSAPSGQGFAFPMIFLSSYPAVWSDTVLGPQIWSHAPSVGPLFLFPYSGVLFK